MQIQNRVEAWIRDQRDKILKVSWEWKQKWPPWNNGDTQLRKRIEQEYEQRKNQLHDMCRAFKAESVGDLQDILCCMVLSECVYKRPANEMVRAVNKFKADFGGHIISLERVQPSSDHVSHRYLLAEAGDTLFASFIGTNQYKDVMADANILQGSIFNEDAMEDSECTEAVDSGQIEREKAHGEKQRNTLEPKPQQLKHKPKPAAHRGFMGRAKGIPALELFKLAQKKKRKLVLCGHSLGGAVAALTTLAILRVISTSSPQKENGKVQVKCITFSQPPVGNAALRDYVDEKGWQNYFKSYCIPEDLVPRILSPAYFRHYNAQPLSVAGEFGTNLSASKTEDDIKTPGTKQSTNNEKQQLVLGVGPIQSSFWRLSRLVPLEGVRRQINKYRGIKVDPVKLPSANDSVVASSIEDVDIEPPTLEIQEGTDGVTLKAFPDVDKGAASATGTGNLRVESSNITSDKGRRWQGVPYLPSYVPFGQLYLLENSSVEPLSGAEYFKLTSVRSMFAELKESFQSHSMKAYRSRFQRIYTLCMNNDASSFLGMEQTFPYLQQQLGLAVAGTVELGHIVELPVIRTATSIVPLGWNDTPGDKRSEPLKVDITGFGLHLCTLVHARVNGNWCSTTVESFPSGPPFQKYEEHPELQKIRIQVGAPLRRPPVHQIVADSVMPMFSSIGSNSTNIQKEHNLGIFQRESFVCPESLSGLCVFFTSDFTTVSKEVHVRTRRVRLLGLEGAGKTSLFRAILGQGRRTPITNVENLHVETGIEEGIAGGVCYGDSAGVNLQDLPVEASRFRDELWMGIRDLSKKTDLLVLVHNLSHRIPRYNQSTISQQPVLMSLLDEAKALGIPWVLAITNKFSVSAHQQKAAIDAVMQAYQASPSTTEVLNSCPYVLPNASLSWTAIKGDTDGKTATQIRNFAPFNLVLKPFRKKEAVYPVEGVYSLCQLIHRVLRSQEEASLQELATSRLLVELAKDRAAANKESQSQASSLTAATVGASVGAGLGIILAVVMGAASALRKP